MASDAPLAAAEVFPQVYLPMMGSKTMLTEDKAHNYKMSQYYAVSAAILLAGIYGRFFGDWASVGWGDYANFLIFWGVFLALGYTGKIKVDEGGLTYTWMLCMDAKYSWNELTIELSTRLNVAHIYSARHAAAVLAKRTGTPRPPASPS